MRTPTPLPAALLLAAGALLAACGGADQTVPPPAVPDEDAGGVVGSGAGGAAGTDGAAGTGTALEVVYDAGPETPEVTWTLTCSPPGGTHPDPAGACEDLAEAEAPFAELPEDVVCTEQYGGPQTARVTGTFQTEPVETTFDRVDGCAISRWESVGRLLPDVGGDALGAGTELEQPS